MKSAKTWLLTVSSHCTKSLDWDVHIPEICYTGMVYIHGMVYIYEIISLLLNPQ